MNDGERKLGRIQMIKKGKKTRAEILRAYNDLIYEQGAKSVTIRKVAERAGISVGNLNYYFKKKSDMGYALASDLYGKTHIILGRCIDDDISRMNKTLIELYITILLFHRIPELQNLALESAADPSISRGTIRALSKIFFKMFADEGIKLEEDIMALAMQSALMTFFFACKLNREKDLRYTTHKFIFLTYGVLFSIIGLPAKPYIDGVMQHIDLLDEDYIIEQIYTMQDYDYEGKRD